MKNLPVLRRSVKSISRTASDTRCFLGTTSGSTKARGFAAGRRLLDTPKNQATMPRVPEDHALIGEAAKIPTSKPTPVLSFSPVVVPAPERLVDLQLKVSAPATGDKLPIILLSHGHGRSNHLSSLNGYGPLVNFWAAHGFVVVQPTHLTSKTLNYSIPFLGPLFWRSRVDDMKLILDHLDHIETSVPFLAGRLDRSRVAVVGHSLGGHTASMLLGATGKDHEDGSLYNLVEPRIKAGVLLASAGAPGKDGKDLSEFAYNNFPFFRQHSFTEMTTPTLVVAGDEDESPHLSTRGVDWHYDPYTIGPAPKSLLVLAGGKHGLGGISGYDVLETTDESPERAGVVQRMTTAYLRSILYPEEKAWGEACKALEGLASLGRTETSYIQIINGGNGLGSVGWKGVGKLVEPTQDFWVRPHETIL